jgi:phenylalanyl-tRNA synthetase beta chain
MGNTGVGLFEVAHVYLPPGPVPEERWRLGGVVEGDFFRAKGIVEAVFEALHVEPTFERAKLRKEFVVGATVPSGWVGTYGPLELDGLWSAFELDLAELFAAVPERILYRDVITYPPLRLDFAFVVDEGVPAGELMATARAAAGEELREVRFLSDYRGHPIPDGKKSVAIAVAFQSPERTLTDEDAARLRASIVEALAELFAAELRS